MRIRVRFSLQGDTGSTVRNSAVAPNLTPRGFVQRGKTGTWQADGVAWNGAATALANVLTSLQEKGTGCIDHIWIYVENEAGPSAGDDDG